MMITGEKCLTCGRGLGGCDPVPGYCSIECYKYEFYPDKFVLHCVACLGDVKKYECKCTPDPSGMMVEVSPLEDWKIRRQEMIDELESLVGAANSRKGFDAPEPQEEPGYNKLPRHDHFVRHSDDEIIDEVQITTEPRYKTSGMSGDEWRIAARTKLLRKGTILAERSYPSLQAAYEHLAWFRRTWREDTNEVSERAWSEHLKIEDRLCHQPGCMNSSSKVYELLYEYDGRGRRRAADPTMRLLRSFCGDHSERGDCGLEDADHNYTDVSDDFILT